MRRLSVTLFFRHRTTRTTALTTVYTKVTRPDYDSRKVFAENPRIKRVVSSLIDGTVSDGGSGDFRELYTSLLDGASWHKPDNYYLLGDIESYVETKLRCGRDYSADRLAFARKQWMNMCNAGKFSSDRTIADYAANIWNVK